ncbi:peptidoglycan-binding protein [Streptosporangium soli]|nr:peptidoglycan-binding protein [Streptosporangium sp. KLBMP 9127]
MRSPRRVLGAVVAGVVVIAGAGWALGTRLRSPADEAALRQAPVPSLVTAPVVKRKLTSTVAVNGALEYGSPVAISLAGVVGGGSATGTSAGPALQRVTRAPRRGTVTEGKVLMEVNGRPVFTLRGSVPMHRTIGPGASGADVRQLQRALRRMGYGGPASGVFDAATAAAVQRWYGKRGYRAQEPDLAARQTLDQLRQAVQTAEEDLLTDRRALAASKDVKLLKTKLGNARAELRTAEADLDEAEALEVAPEDARQFEELGRALRGAEEELAAAEQALAAAKPEDDKRLLELKVSNARANLAAARASLELFAEQAADARGERLEELRTAVRTAKEAVLTADQALKQARETAPLRLKIVNGGRNVARAKANLAEYRESYGVSVPPGEIVFLPKLPARLDRTSVQAGAAVGGAVGTVTSSTFAVTGSVDDQEAELLRTGMKAVIETEQDKRFPARLTAFGPGAETGAEEKKEDEEDSADLGSVPVLLTPAAAKGLRALAGVPVTVRISVGETDGEVLTVPVAAVVTSADGRPRVQVEYATDRTRDVEVRTGLTADGQVQITGDLREGDRVVIGNG